MGRGALAEPRARIKVDEKCFGMIEWKAVREASSRFLPKHTAAAAWKHRDLSHVEQDGLAPVPEDRGAEQGDGDGPLECSLVLASGSLPWIGVVDPSELQRLQADHAVRLQETANLH